MSLYLRQVRAIVWKDLLLELRTRERIAAMAAFAVLAGVLFNYSLDTARVAPQDVAAGLVWMTIVFGGLLGIGRTFSLEAQARGPHVAPGPELDPAPESGPEQGEPRPVVVVGPVK